MPVKLQLAASCLKAPSPGHVGATSSSPTTEESEWSGLLINEQEVAVHVHPVQAVDVCMASSSNSIELTPLWPKSGSPSHCMRGGGGSGGVGGGGSGAWPADHKTSNTKVNGQRAPPPPPPPKNQPPPHPPQLPITSSREFQLQRKQQQELSSSNNRRLHPEGGGGSESKGPAPQPPTSNVHPVTSQPLRPSASVSRGLQVEEDDLIQFTNGLKVSLANGTVTNGATAASAALSTSASVAQLKKQLRSRLSLDDEELEDEEEEEEEEETTSARTADEQMDYLDSLEPCPCYAKCCLDSIISLFCVTVLG